MHSTPEFRLVARPSFVCSAATLRTVLNHISSLSTCTWRQLKDVQSIAMSVSVCPSVCLFFVCLSADISRKPRRRASPNFLCVCVCAKGLSFWRRHATFSAHVYLHYRIVSVTYFRFRIWRHVLARNGPYGASCVLLAARGQLDSRNYRIDSNQILLSDNDQQVLIAGCRPGPSLPSTIASFALSFSNNNRS